MVKKFLPFFLLILIGKTILAQETGPYKIGVSWSSSLRSNKESFEFLLNGTHRLRLEPAQVIAYFPVTLEAGQSYTVVQTAGPRAIRFQQSPNGVMPAGELLLTLEGGNPPLTIFKMKVTGIEQGEVFKFADNYGRTYTVPFSTTLNLGGYPLGDDYRIEQREGPRAAKMSLHTGVVPDSGIIVIADCRKPTEPFQPPKQKTDLISRSSDNKILSTYYESWTPVAGGRGVDEGRYVAFTMYGKGVDGSSGNYRQVFWRDRKAGITRLVSKTAAGQEGNGNCAVPAISADGMTVAFETYASNLAEGDINGARDVFVWKAGSGSLQLVSKTAGGLPGNGESTEPVISGDGNVVAYTSAASDIVKLEPVFNTPNVYITSLASGTTACISRDYETGMAAGGYAPSISEDGNRIAFCAYSYRLVPNDNNGLWDIFLWENGVSGLQRISVASNGADRKQGNESASRVVWPSISGDGNYIVYATTADGLDPADLNGFQDIYMYNVSTRQVKRISVPGVSSEANGDSPIAQGERIGISYDGRWITYNTTASNMGVPKGNIIMQHTGTGRIIPITQTTAGSTARPMISRHGRFVVAGCSEKYDPRFGSSGLFAFYTGELACEECY